MSDLVEIVRDLSTYEHSLAKKTDLKSCLGFCEDQTRNVYEVTEQLTTQLKNEINLFTRLTACVETVHHIAILKPDALEVPISVETFAHRPIEDWIVPKSIF
jgi:hypothetical protein